jgi:hypothetical protein
MAIKAIKALELRKSGASFEVIAAELGYQDKSGARKAVLRALETTLQEPAQELRTLECERLDQLLFAVWSDALEGDVRAVDRVLRIMDQRAKLLGLNAPTRVDVDQTVTVDPSEIEVVRLVREWRADRE